jgi:hypothetical protein
MQQCPLAILPDAGDQVRLLRGEPPPSTPASSPAILEDPTQPRYPEVQVQLSGEDGNAFAILGRTTAALRAAGVSSEEIDAFFAEATSGDYDHLLQTTTSPPTARVAVRRAFPRRTPAQLAHQPLDGAAGHTDPSRCSCRQGRRRRGLRRTPSARTLR